jgi:hypothetical protein
MRNGSRQRTAIFSCELRDELGFGAPLLSIADELVLLAAQQDCTLQTIFVLTDPIYYGSEVASHGHMVLPAPSMRHPFEISSMARSYGSLLAASGFTDERQLNLIVEAWDRTFAILSPDLLVVDNSPAACLAARGHIPTFVTGSGFSAPPADMAAFPSLVKGVHPEINQTLIRDVVNRILRKRGVPRIETLPELFAGDLRAVFTMPQLDPYHEYRNERVFRPCIDIKEPLPACETPSIFFTAPSTFTQLIEVGRALERQGAAIFCYVPGPRSVGLTLLAERGAHVFDKRPPLNEVLSVSRVVLSGSADLALAAFLAGRPNLVLRTDTETCLLASELEKRRTAISVEISDMDKLHFSLGELLNNSSYVQSSREEARRAHTLMPSDGSSTSAARGLDLMLSS